MEPVRLADDASAVRIIDQRRLPGALVERDLRTVEDMVEAIRTLAVRGAPAIGLCAAAGLAVATRPHAAEPRKAFLARVRAVGERLAAARPTAVNLAWAVARCEARLSRTAGDGAALHAALVDEARTMHDEDLRTGRRIAAFGLDVLRNPLRVLTHCNAGALATAGAGTALAPIYAANERGWSVVVYATETRPLLQGARLTAWELQRAGIPVTVIPDGAAAALMQARLIDAVLVGADRIAANGDVANKIGTYALAVTAAFHSLPFYVCAPWSTIDVATSAGASIPIEVRGRDELARCGDAVVLPDGVEAWTQAFDVTPATLVTAIITDRGIHRPPFAFTAA